jgi:hypothetical protein
MYSPVAVFLTTSSYRCEQQAEHNLLCRIDPNRDDVTEEEVPYDTEPTGDEEKIPEYEGESLYERLGGVYGIAGAVDILVDRLYENEAANENPAVQEFHENYGKAGFKYLVTA